jgi:Ser/Thr protein kinase RdoA (MazF antagonist)
MRGVPAPTTEGEVWADLDGTPLALFPFLPGETHRPWSIEERAAVGRALAALHRATPPLAEAITRREAFAVAYEPALRANLDAAESTPADARPGLIAARAWAAEYRSAVEGQLERLHALRRAARAIGCPLVLCHTDLHHNNVLIDDGGALTLLDWDDACLAPPEHDVWIAIWDAESRDEVQALVEGYRAAGGTAALHDEHFAFYLLRRYVEDVAVALARLLAVDADPRDDEAWARGLYEWSTPRWSRLDEQLAMLAAATS